MGITISFDMDGTIASLYSVDNWLAKLRAYDPSPYAEAKPLVNLSALARQINRLQRKGYHFEIISWCSKVSTKEYDEAVAEAKRKWLAKHMPSVYWDKINIIPYGTPKSSVGAYGILFDDELPNRIEWQTNRKYLAYDETQIFEVLRGM